MDTKKDVTLIMGYPVIPSAGELTQSGLAVI